MNKPAEPKQGWQAKWYLWDGGFLTLGRSTTLVPPHAHHAIQILLRLDGVCGLAEPGGVPLNGDGLIVMADSPHELHTVDARYGLVFVDPEAMEGRWLRRSYSDGISPITPERCAAAIPVLRGVDENPGAAEIIARDIHAIVRALCIGPEPQRPLDDRIRRALAVIREMDTSRITLEHVAGDLRSDDRLFEVIDGAAILDEVQFAVPVHVVPFVGAPGRAEFYSSTGTARSTCGRHCPGARSPSARRSSPRCRSGRWT